MDEFLKSLAAFIFLVGANWLKEAFQDRKKRIDEAKKANAKADLSDPDFINLRHEIVKNLENEIMKAWRPVRMFIMYRYNGEFTEARVSLQKVIIRHEIILHSGIRYMAHHFRGDPCPEMLYNIFKQLSQNGHYSITEREEENPPLNTWQDTWRFLGATFIDLHVEGSPKLSAILVMQWPGANPLHRNDIGDILASEAVLKIEKVYQAKSLADLKKKTY